MQNDRKLYAKTHLKESKDILEIILYEQEPLTCKEIVLKLPYWITSQQISCLIEFNLKPYLNRIIKDGKAYFSIGGDKCERPQ